MVQEVDMLQNAVNNDWAAKPPDKVSVHPPQLVKCCREADGCSGKLTEGSGRSPFNIPDNIIIVF